MNGPTSDKFVKLQAMLEQQPNDTFLLYALAMEYKKAGDTAQALDFLGRVIAVDSGYCYAYYQRGQIFEETGDIVKAKMAYGDGLKAADRVRDSHARSELQTALNMLD